MFLSNINSGIASISAWFRDETATSATEMNLRQYANQKNEGLCAINEEKLPINQSEVDISILNLEQIENIASMIKDDGLTHVPCGSKPIYSWEKGGDEEALGQAIEALQKKYTLKEKFMFLNSGAFGFSHYLVNKINLLETVKKNQAILEDWFMESFKELENCKNSFYKKAAKLERESFESREHTPEEMTEYFINLLSLKCDSYITSKIFGVLLGYGVKNAENFYLTNTRYEDKSNEDKALCETLRKKQDSSLIDKNINEISQQNSRFVDFIITVFQEEPSFAALPGVATLVSKISKEEPSFVSPPRFVIWDDEEGEIETAALYTHYLNESLDMSETILKPAFRTGEFDKKAAVQAFFNIIFESQPKLVASNLIV